MKKGEGNEGNHEPRGKGGSPVDAHIEEVTLSHISSVTPYTRLRPSVIDPVAKTSLAAEDHDHMRMSYIKNRMSKLSFGKVCHISAIIRPKVLSKLPYVPLGRL